METLAFNIDIPENSWYNAFKLKLKEVKQHMESDSQVNYYMNLWYGKDDSETIDLKRMATVEICFDGLVLYSATSFDTMIIPWRSIRNIDLVEVKP